MRSKTKRGSSFNKNILKLFVIFGICLMILAGSVMLYVVSSITYYNHTIPFDISAVKIQSNSPKFFDISGEEIGVDLKDKYIATENISQHFIDAIISVEDKKFYNHNGIDYIRTAKALIRNILNGRIKEGGSTISQQLVKNKLLTNERTFTRKLKEASLVLRMEKELTKEEILESYFNSIYYGNNQYGLENASYYYFNKSAKSLNLSESATLAGIIQAPSLYAKNYEKLLNRRNLVLTMMLKNGKITKEEYKSTKEAPINFIEKEVSTTSNYINEVIYETSEKLNKTTNEIKEMNLKIYTNLNTDLLKTISNVKTDCLHSSAVVDKNGRVLALIGKNNKREPGSVVKPFFSYAPALELNLITPESFIFDDKVDYGNFAPSNYESKYYGEISVRDALRTSSNTVAVKLANYVGVNKVKHFVKRLGVNLTSKDDLSISLGHLEKGMNLTEISGMYTTLLNNGEYVSPSFIDKIETADGLVIYENNYNKTFAFREDTAFLLNEMLVETAKTGTARKLSSLPFEVGSKTGTVGIGNGRVENTDAYNIAYTSDLILITRINSLDNKDENLLPREITGAGLPTQINKQLLEKIYSTALPSSFIMPASICEVELDAMEFEKHNIALANEFTPERYKIKKHFSIFNIPKAVSTNFIKIDAPQFKLTEENDMAKLSFYADYGKTYELYKNDAKIKNITSLGYTEIYDDIKSREAITYSLVAKQQNFANGTEIISEPYTKTIYIKKELKEILDEEILNKTTEFKESLNLVTETKKKQKQKPNVKFNFSKFFDIF